MRDDIVQNEKAEDRPKPKAGKLAELVGMAAALIPPAVPGKDVPKAGYTADECDVCHAPAGHPLPCGFCPVPIKEKKIEGKSL